MQANILIWMLEMKIVVTGAKGFIGSNLCLMLKENGFSDVVEIDKESTRDEISQNLRNADFVFHLAGVNRPQDDSEFKEGNVNFTAFIVSELEKSSNHSPIMLSSSIQADVDNLYGMSKAMAENAIEAYGEKTGANTYIYRFPNVFGKWCRPNYNSFIATFCHNIINDIDIQVNDPSSPVTLIYIDDVCKDLISLLSDKHTAGFKKVSPEYTNTVGEVLDLLRAFKVSRETLITEEVGADFTRALYATYLSYFKPEQFSYNIPSYDDERGVFCEMLKTPSSGQFSFFTSLPGITRGGHYHHSKNEKFLVIKGQALFKFEHVITGEHHELVTAGDKPRIVETVPGWIHDVTNIGDDELIVMLWANENFDRENPDTIARVL